MKELIVLLFLAAGSCAAAWSAARRSRREELASRLLRLRPPSGVDEPVPPGEGGGRRARGTLGTMLGRPLTRLGHVAVSLPSCPDALELEKAGLAYSPGQFQALRVLLLAALSLAVLFLGGPALLLVSALPATLLAWRLPHLALKRKQRRRQEAVSDALPEVLDLLTLLLHAGQGLNLALPRAVACSGGPLRDEFERAFRSLELGMPRQQAFSSLVERNSSEDLRRFIRALLRAERFGAPLSSSIEHLAAEMRHRQKGRLQERAHKAPVKILFPLVFLILPSFLLLTVGGMLLGGRFL